MHYLNATVVSNEPSSSAYYTMTLAAPAVAVAAQPGQFVMISAGPQTFLKRPMGLSGANPAAGTIEFIYQVVGQGTKNLTGFQAGDAVGVLGPLGTWFELGQSAPLSLPKSLALRPATSQVSPALTQAVLIGGGTGTGPMLYLASWLRDHHPSIEVTLVLGARTGPLHVDTAPLAGRGIHVFLATDDGSLGTKGTVLDILSSQLSPLPAGKAGLNSLHLFACGPDRMMHAVARLAADRQIPCQVSLEARMACGFGACLGCAVKRADGTYAMACVDGPVVKTEDIRWDD